MQRKLLSLQKTEMMRATFIIIFLFGYGLLQAQVIDNAATYRNIGASKYIRLHYENDYFSTTDIYYTQGVNIEFVHPALAKTFLPNVLVHLSKAANKYGISIEHLGYSPTSITHTEILTNDRPFASCFFLKAFSIANDSVRGIRLVSSLSLGVIGPAAGGAEVQRTIHRWIDGTPPQGWHNQIQNDVIINYQFDYERQLISLNNYFLLTGKAGFHVGTLSDKVYSSTMLMTGLFDNPFTNFSRCKKKYQVYIYLEPQVNVVAFDAALQGGLFNSNSPYTIASRNMARVVFQGNAGLIVKANKLTLEYFQTFLTKEFNQGGTHQWGGVRLGWSF